MPECAIFIENRSAVWSLRKIVQKNQWCQREESRDSGQATVSPENQSELSWNTKNPVWVERWFSSQSFLCVYVALAERQIVCKRLFILGTRRVLAVIFNYGFYWVLCGVEAPGIYSSCECSCLQILVRENHYPNLYMNDLVICKILTCGEVNL